MGQQVSCGYGLLLLLCSCTFCIHTPCLLCLLSCLYSYSPHHQPPHKRLQGEHLPPPQEDLHHDQGQVCQGAAPHQGQDLILVLGKKCKINIASCFLFNIFFLYFKIHYYPSLAHTRQKMIRTITSLHHLPHLLSNNQQTSLSDRYSTCSTTTSCAHAACIPGCSLAPSPTRTRPPTTPGSSTASRTRSSSHPRTSSMILSSTMSFQESSCLKTLNEIFFSN